MSDFNNKIDYFKKSISIIEFIRQHYKDGEYKFERVGSNVKCKFYVDSKKESSIIISQIQKNGIKQDVYFPTENINFKAPKSIIDFTSNIYLKEDKISFFKVFSTLENYMKQNKFVSLEDSKFVIPKQVIKKNTDERKQFLKDTYKLFSNVSFEYLKSRKIDTNLMSNDIFSHRIGTYLKKDHSTEIKMPAFPLLDEKGKLHTFQWVDFDSETKTHKIKQMAPGITKNEALFITEEKDTKIAIFTEAPEKCIAHYQLYSKDLNKKPLYASPCGAPNILQIERMVNLSKERELTILAFDNDKIGEKYTIEFLINYHHPKSNYEIIIQPNGTYSVKLELNNDEQKVFKKSISLNQDMYKNTVINFGPKEIESVINLPNNMKIHRSITVDFLDDLNDKLYLPFKFQNDNKLKI